jgi:hypothetical protein
MRPAVNRLVRRVRLGTEAALALTGAGVALRLLPSRRMTLLLGRVRSPDECAVVGVPGADAQWVGIAVERVAAVLPWHPVCLPQAVATRWMLARRGIPSETHLGVMATAPFAAHAWVTVNGTVVQGAPVADATPLAAFR